MAQLSPVDKKTLLRDLEALPPEAVAEVRAFIEFQKYKTQTSTQVGAIAIRGWLSDFRFENHVIEQARAEMWARFQDNSA